MGNKKEGKSKRKIVNAGKTLFSNNGFSTITVEGVCQKAGVSKMTFYRYFDNKMQLAEQVVQRIFEDNYLKHRDLMDSQLPFTIKMYRWTTMKAEGSLEISPKLVEDIEISGKPRLKEILHKELEKEEAMTLADIKAAQKENLIRKNVKPELVLYLLREIVRLTNKAQKDKLFTSKNQAIIDMTDFFFYGVLQK